jgi:probable F420-dependent oxidoreductase
MRFGISLAFQPVDQLVAIAREADACGYDALTIPDHVVELESLETPYPYTPDGSRRWDHSADWPDPWVLTGALAQVTRRIRFFTTVYVAALRSPYQVAKSVGTAAVLSGDRVALGVGVGWCREEFDLMAQDFSTRGSRTDEALDLVQALWQPGWTESAGRHYPTPRIAMEPTPRARVPIYVGGLSEVAFARAVRHDGWIGDLYTIEEAGRHARRLNELREKACATREFRIITALTDAFVPEQFLVAEEAGVTDVMTMPWAYYHGLEADLEQKIDGIRRFADKVITPLQQS